MKQSSTVEPPELLKEYALWCAEKSPTMYQKMCYWHDKAMELQAALEQGKG